MDYTLFPPIIESKMPAFLQNEECKVYFSLSEYNNISQIANCQVTISYQNSNNSALDPELYPSSIKLCELLIDNNIYGDAKYYIIISPNDLNNNDNMFDISQYYKIQIRFTSTQAEYININIASGIDNWLANNLLYFSQWSEICLIKAISQPTLNMLTSNENNDYIQTIISNYYTVNFEGIVKFSDSTDNQHVRAFNVEIYQDDILFDTSEQIYTNPYDNINKIKYSTSFELEPDKTYKFIFNITTNNFYYFSEEYNIIVNKAIALNSNLKIKVFPDRQNGRMKITLNNTTNSKYYNGNIVIKRASGKKNFSDWVDIHIEYISGQNILEYIWYDPTIQSGQLYLYGVQEVFNNGSKSKVSVCDEPKLVDFQHMYLSCGGRQLNIKFDPQINSFQRITSQTRIETIGSKYPWFYKNGAIDYKTFSISGTISALMENPALMKASKEELYGNRKQWYDNYNQEYFITPYNDYIYEKDFREQVINFLYQNNIKLFRSATEGNIFVKLMDINFTPNNTLGRRIYSFSCTAYEADEFNIKNCLNKYNILKLNSIQKKTKEELSLKSQTFGQIIVPNSNNKINFFGTQDLVNTMIKNNCIHHELSNYTLSVQNLSYLKIELTSKPYLIRFYDGVPSKIDPIKEEEMLQPPEVFAPEYQLSYPSMLGHIVNINDSPIVINENGILELNNDINITKISFVDNQETGYINYIANIIQEPNTNILPIQQDTVFTYYNTIGQLWGEFQNNESLYNKIYNKYNQSYTLEDALFNTHLQQISFMKITAAPGTIFQIKESQDSAPESHIIGKTGVLLFNGEYTNIKEICFKGIHLNKVLGKKQAGKENEYIEIKLPINKIDLIEKPGFNCVYNLSAQIASTVIGKTFNQRQRCIYYKDNWYLFNQDDNILDIDYTDVIIDYQAIIYKGRTEE